MTRSDGRTGRALAGVVLVLLAATAVAAAPAHVTAHGARFDIAFTRTVEPFVPGQPPATPPTVLPTVACVRAVGGLQLEAVFGFVNHGPLSADAPISGNENRVVLERFRRPPVEASGPQVTQFVPGSHPHEFAVRFRIGQIPVWKVRVPSSDGDADPAWLASVRPTFLKWCDRHVPRHFSVVQAVPDQFTLSDVAHDALGNVVGYSYEAAFDLAVTACSAGGTPLPPDVVVGWSNGAENLEPLAADDIIATEVRGNAEYQLSRVRTRPAIDVSRPTIVTLPSNDVTGRCSFPDGSVVDSTTYWSDHPAIHQIDPVEVDGLLTLVPSAVLPGGTKFR